VKPRVSRSKPHFTNTCVDPFRGESETSRGGGLN
jgi:hypothetical protein